MSETQTLQDLALHRLPLGGVHVIDGHCHLGPNSEFFQPGNDAATMVRTMDRIGIDQSCVFSTLAIGVDVHAGNTMSLDAAREFPDRILAYVVPDPHQPDRVEDEVRRCLDEGARGIKFHTLRHAYPFEGPAYAPALAIADEQRLPLISHGVGTPEVLRRTARAYPNAHIIVAHIGAGGLGAQWDALHHVAAEEPNVYLDLASSGAVFGAFADVVQRAGAHKLTYGSDSPYMCATYQIGRVLFAPIAEDDKRRILGANLAALLATRR